MTGDHCLGCYYLLVYLFNVMMKFASETSRDFKRQTDMKVNWLNYAVFVKIVNDWAH